MIRVEIKHYDDLNKNEFHEIISLRIAVFVVEQNCPYQELDGLDLDAYHLMATENHAIIGTTRILKPGVMYNELAIGRVASHIDHRNQRLGHLMMKGVMQFVQYELKLNTIRLSAQSHLKSYYERYGFKPTGKDYPEDGVPHCEMLYKKEK